MPELDLPDITLHYEIGGSGPPLVLLAGMFSDSASWAPLVPALEAQFTLIRPDNRAAGRTRPVDAPVSVGRMAADVIALLDALGIARAHVAGHSMGGLMAMDLAHMAPERCASLTMLATAPMRVPRTAHLFDTLLAIRAQPEGERLWLAALYPWLFAPRFFDDPARVAAALDAALAYPHAQSLAAMDHQLDVLRHYRRGGRPGDLDLPAQIILGREDLLIPEAPARAAWSAMPQAELHVLADAGHSLHWDAPEALCARLTDFLARHPLPA